MKSVKLVLDYWLRRHLVTAMSDTWRFFGKTRTALVTAALSVGIGSAAFILIYGADGKGKAVEELITYFSFTIVPAIAFALLLFLWYCLYLPAELYDRFVAHHSFREFESRAMSLWRAGSRLLTTLRSSPNVDPTKEETAAVSAWILDVHKMLTEMVGHEDSSWHFKFDDTEMLGASMLDDATLKFRSHREGSEAKRETIRSTGARLTNLHLIIFEIGKMATEKRNVGW